MRSVGQGTSSPDSLQGRRIEVPPSPGADSLRWQPVPTDRSLPTDQVSRTLAPAGPKPAMDAALARHLSADPQKPGTTGGAKAGKTAAPHATEFYSMDGQLMGSFMNTSPYARVMVDEEAYGTYLEATFANLDLDAPDVATAFVTGVVDALNREEAATKTDLIAKETKQVLTFTGKAVDKTLSAKTRQLGEGSLNVVSLFDNGRQAEVASFEAISGPMSNGLIPNGRYKALAPVDASRMFPDETGKWGFKMVLIPQQKMNRSDFRIHSVQERTPYHAWMTEGCVGLSGGHAENVRFHGMMQTYFQNHKSIALTVDIEGNANVTTQLGEKPGYQKVVAPKPTETPKPVPPADDKPVVPAEIRQIQAQNALLWEEIARLKAEIAQLRGQLAKPMAEAPQAP